SFKGRFLRHPTTHCEVSCYSLPPKISRLLPGSDIPCPDSTRSPRAYRGPLSARGLDSSDEQKAGDWVWHGVELRPTRQGRTSKLRPGPSLPLTAPFRPFATAGPIRLLTSAPGGSNEVVLVHCHF